MNRTQKWSVGGMILGGLLCASPLVGLMGTIMGMTKAFDTLGKSSVGDPAELSAAIGETLFSFTVSVVLAVLGVVMLLLSLVFFMRPRKSMVASPSRTRSSGDERIG